MFQSNKKDQISPVTRQYLVGHLTMKYQNRRSFWFYSGGGGGEGATASEGQVYMCVSRL